MESPRRLIIDETIIMCPGHQCAMRWHCYRYRLNHFFEFIAKTPHKHPVFLDPAYNKQKHCCHFFREVKFQGE